MLWVATFIATFVGFGVTLWLPSIYKTVFRLPDQQALLLSVLSNVMILLAVFSFNDSPIISLPWAGFTTHWYSVAADDAEAREAVIHSVTVAIFVTVLSVSLGTMAAGLAHEEDGK